MKTNTAVATNSASPSGLGRNLIRAIAKTGKSYYDNKFLVLLFLPAILFFLVFSYAPMYGVIIAFKDYKFLDGILGSPWAPHSGLGHFYTMLHGLTFPRVFLNTILISFYKLIFGFPAPIIFALLLNEVKAMKYKKVMQTVSYMPHFIGWVILAGILKQFLSPSIGPVGAIMTSVGLKPVNFLAEPDWIRAVLVSTSIWKDLGWNTIIYLATIAGIDSEIYEAAIVDGASRLKCMIHITLPSLRYVIAFLFTMSVGSIISDDFDQIYNLTVNTPSVLGVADVISTYTYRQGIVMMDYGYGAAVGLFRNAIAIVLLFVTDQVIKRTTDGELSIF